MNNMKSLIYSFIKSQNIEIDDDVFSYGYSIVKSYAIILGILIPICYLNKTFIETIIFLITFSSLRQYLGGLHFDSQLLCIIISLIVAIAIPLASKYFGNISGLIRFVIFSISIINLNIIGPIDHHNKRLSEIEKNIFKSRANLIILIYAAIGIFIYPFLNQSLGNTIIMTITLMNFNLIIPYFLKSLQKK